MKHAETGTKLFKEEGERPFHMLLGATLHICLYILLNLRALLPYEFSYKLLIISFFHFNS